MQGLLVTVAPLVAQTLGRTGSVIPMNCFIVTACGIFPDQGSNRCPPALAGGFLTPRPPGEVQPCSSLVRSSGWNSRRVFLAVPWILPPGLSPLSQIGRSRSNIASSLLNQSFVLPSISVKVTPSAGRSRVSDPSLPTSQP